ncbi:MAG: GTPase HflX [Bdellovibrionales bacterium]|nr:GTPase HflX [Bdellovibrionales bacterium]
MKITSLNERPKAIVIGVGLKSEGIYEIKASLNELEELVNTAGWDVVGSITQMVHKWTPATLIGTGKVEEIGDIALECGAQFVIIDHQLSGVQTRNLEEIWKGIQVLDRAQIIIEIFSQRARSYEGKLQVELAQLLDQLPRQVGAWLGSLSRQGGGIGTRGLGETALELDRRQIRRRIDAIKRKLKDVQKTRGQHRSSREKKQIPSFALIGYTNSGKSTLMNKLTSAEVYAEDQLFATLDPTTRKIYLEEGTQSVITDTVGFINKLPHHLIEAFKATFEESASSDILLHVIDLSNPRMDKQVEVVNSLIDEFGWNDKPIVHVYNKVDVAPVQNRFKVKLHPRVFVSAHTGEGLEDLKALMADTLKTLTIEIELFIPLEKSHLVYELNRDATSLYKEESGLGIYCKAHIIPALAKKWQDYRVNGKKRGRKVLNVKESEE